MTSSECEPPVPTWYGSPVPHTHTHTHTHTHKHTHRGEVEGGGAGGSLALGAPACMSSSRPAISAVMRASEWFWPTSLVPASNRIASGAVFSNVELIIVRSIGTVQPP